MTTPNNIIKGAERVDEVLDAAIGNAQTVVGRSIKRLEQRIMSSMKALETSKNGELVGPRVNLKQAQKVHQDLAKYFEEMYGTGLHQAMDGFDEVAKAIKDNWPDLDDAIEFTGVDYTVMDTLKKQSLEEFRRFGDGAREQIATAMYDHVVANGTFGGLVAEMAAVLGTGLDKRGNNMARYAKLWANDAIMNFHQAVTMNKANQAGLKSFLYVGNIMRTSRPFCIDRAGKVFTKKEIESWNDMWWDGKRGPAMTYRGGWNCRHHWTPIKKEWLPKGSTRVGDYFKENKIEVKRGTTIPEKPKRSRKPGVPKPPKKRPKSLNAPYVDPKQRFVPVTPPFGTGKAKAWGANMQKQGKLFTDWSGLGPCGPVADNIVEVLEGQGRRARVMFTEYLPKGVTDPKKAFPHYVAVEVDGLNRVSRIYDPVNPYAKQAIIEVERGVVPLEYAPKDTMVRWAPKRAEEAIKLVDTGPEQKMATQMMAKIKQKPGKIKKYYGTEKQLKGGIAYDVGEEGEIIVQTLGGFKKGGASTALLEVVEEARAKGVPLYINANRCGGFSAEALERIGFKKDLKRGKKWYGMVDSGAQMEGAEVRLKKTVAAAKDAKQWRMDTQVFGEGVWARDDGGYYDMSHHEWWFGKMGATAKKVKSVGKTYEWKYVTNRGNGRKALGKLVEGAGDNYPLYTQGLFRGQPVWRFRHEDWKQLRGRRSEDVYTKVLHGKVNVGAEASVETLNIIGRKFAELQNRATKLGLPRLRGLGVCELKKANVAANMGDGVLSVNVKYANKLSTSATFMKEKYKESLEKFSEECKVQLRGIAKREGKRGPAYLGLQEELRARERELRMLRDGTWQSPAFGVTKQRVTAFKPQPGKTIGQQVGGARAGANMPQTGKDYYATGVEKLRVSMDHELGHHIHNTLFVGTDAVRYKEPPLEKWLEHFFGDWGIAQSADNVSKYSMVNHKEWFAENYSMWKNGKKQYVRKRLRGLFTALDELEEGKITEKELWNRMFKGQRAYMGYKEVK